jgi:flagellin-like protein
MNKAITPVVSVILLVMLTIVASTGAYFRKDGILQKINPYVQRKMAREAGLNTVNGNELLID